MNFKTQLGDMEEIWTRQAANGDLDAFNQLVLKHQDLVYRHTCSMLNDGWLAEEVVQESFLKAFQNMKSFRGGSFRAWLMRIATNTAYDVLRQSSKRPTQPLLPDDDDGEEIESPSWLADPNASVEGAVEEEEQTKFIYDTLNELQDIYRNVITLVDLQDFDYEEAAQVLNVPIGTVKSRLARARMQMQEKLQACPSMLENYQVWMHKHPFTVERKEVNNKMNTTDQHNMHDHSNHKEEPMMDHSQHMGHTMPANMDHSAHAGHNMPANMDHSAHGADHSGHEQMFRVRFWWSLLLSIPVLVYSEMIQMWLGFMPPMFPFAEWIPFVFSLVIFAYGGIPFLQMAVPELKERKPGMMTLISLAISVAFIYSVAAEFIDLGEGFFWELVTLIDIMLLGHWLEMRSVRQASGALNELAKLMPDTAERIIKGSVTETVSVVDLKHGDLILIRPGASVPADGNVVDGHSNVSEAMITGESKPVHKMNGMKVIAGTLNGDGSLRVKVTATGDETALAGIMRLVEQAQQSKSKTQVLADKAAGWLFYIALASAILTAIAWTIADAFNIDVLNRVVTVLVIACPHALGLAVPLVVAITTAMGAKNGILVRNRLALEAAREIDVVIFDKTGTLTQGQFGVVDMVTADGWDTDQALALAAALESDSEHLIAQSIRRLARDRKLVIPPVSHFFALKGRGVQASFENETYYIGGPRLLEQLALAPQATIADFTNSANVKSQSVVYLTTQKSIISAIAVADVIRAESKQAVDELKRMGIEVAMLTGDSQAVAKAVAYQLGIQRVFAEVLPEHKDQKVAELQSLGKRVAMVGDGVNDAPALTRADVGIAIGGGTDVAIESAGLILVNSNPLDVVKIFKLSRASYRKMIQNLWWAAGYNIIAIPLAAGVLANWGILLSPAFGAVLMSVSTIVVAINAQLLRRTSL